MKAKKEIMTSTELSFHRTTVFEDAKIVKKNFLQPLNMVNRISEVHCNIRIRERVTPMPKEQDAFYISKEVEVDIVDNEDLKIAEIEIIFTFRFSNVENYIEMLSPSSVRLDPLLSEWLDNIVLATTRGVMISEFRGTYVGEIILPLVTPGEVAMQE